MNPTALHLRRAKHHMTNGRAKSPPAGSTFQTKSTATPSHMMKTSSLTTFKLPPLTKAKPVVPPRPHQKPLSPKRHSGTFPVTPAFEKPTLDHFRLMRVVGTGTFSRVKMAQSKMSQEIVVIKIMRKAEIMRMRQAEHVKNEKTLLGTISHPFIVNLRYTFQDRDNLYIVMEYVPGGELYRFLRRQGQFSTQVAKFYVSEVICALAYLHDKGVVYRDLKPENILLTKLGHVKLADFGFAKVLKPGEKTFTLCGTPEYLAPEVIQQRGHSFECDWWGVGILIYEMVCGHAPFLDHNPFKLYEKIINCEVAFPTYFDRSLQSLVEDLLKKDVGMRIDQEHILRHEFFSDTDWGSVTNSQLTPPYMPVIRAPDDTSNFDEYPDEPAGHDTVPISSDIFANF